MERMAEETNKGGNAPHKEGTTVSTPQRICFLLLENFTLIAHASAIEPLRMANQLSGRELYQWFSLSEDGGPVRASDGQRVLPDAAMADAPDCDMVIVCAGIAQQKAIRPAHLSFLQHQARLGRRLGGVCTGTWALAQAGLLDGYRASIHWECLSGLQEAFPRVLVTSGLFTSDKGRLTASGGTAPLDMMLFLIGQQHGKELMNGISEMFMCDRIRGEHEQQRVPLRHIVGTSQPKLLEVVALMEANIEEPLEIEELATCVGVSKRQIERLFERYLGCSPSRYYLTIRVNRARQLLLQTPMTIIEVATACGFVSTPHFSKCYRGFFGVQPSSERGTKNAASHGEAPPAACPTPPPRAVRPCRQEHVVSAAELSLLLAQGESTFGSVSRRGH